MDEIYSKEKLKQLLLEKTGVESASEKTCEQISIAIFKKNKNYISKRTLMRFFGLIPADGYKISPVIMEMLEQFLR